MSSAHRSRPLTVAFALVAVLALVVGIIAWRGGRAADTGRAGQSGDSTAAGPSDSSSTSQGKGGGEHARGSGRPFLPGEQSIYRLSIEQDIAFHQQAQAGPNGKPGAPVPAGPGFHYHLAGEWQATVVDASDEEVHVELRLVNPELSMTTEGRDTIDAATRRRLLYALALPHFAALAPSGAVKNIYFARECDTLSRGFLRLVLGETQFVAPDVRSEQWETEEADTTGRYVASYQKQFDGGRYKKQKRRYLQLSTANGLITPPPGLTPKLTSDYQIAVGSDQWPDDLRGQQQLEVESGNGFPTVSSKLDVSLKRTARQRNASRIGAFANERGRLQSETPYSGTALAINERDQDLRMLDGATLTQLLAAAAALPEGKENEEKRNRATAVLLEKLRSLLRLEPGQADAAVQAARTAADPRVADLLVGALEAASTAESIHGLGELARDQSLSHDLRMHATASLGLAEKPTGDALTALREVSRESDPDLRSTAQLALGNAGKNFGQNNEPTSAKSVVEELKSALRSATSPEEQAVYLRALGNTASAEALPPIVEALKSPLLAVRQAAVEALRLIPDPGVDRIIAGVLSSDTEATIRRSAVFAMSFRDPGVAVPVLGSTLRSEQSTGVRNDIIHVVGRFGLQTPGVREVLTWVTQNDPQQDLRNAAAAYLKS
ncbi:MAG TPA: HEAT repeat domain-containing protein [Polyangia bacterium]|jgi:HEAT repeat protein|nr:HEAT repeat domain-containing protein [Polyangia bacterium]